MVGAAVNAVLPGAVRWQRANNLEPSLPPSQFLWEGRTGDEADYKKRLKTPEENVCQPHGEGLIQIRKPFKCRKNTATVMSFITAALQTWFSEVP